MLVKLCLCLALLYTASAKDGICTTQATQPLDIQTKDSMYCPSNGKDFVYMEFDCSDETTSYGTTDGLWSVGDKGNLILKKGDMHIFGKLKEITFTEASQHKINGVGYDLEMRMHFQDIGDNTAEDTAIDGLRIQSQTSKTLTQVKDKRTGSTQIAEGIVSFFFKIDGSATETDFFGVDGNFNLNQKLECMTTRFFYIYDGFSTKEGSGCSQALWAVAREPIMISQGSFTKINGKISETAEAAVVRTQEVALSGVPCYPDGSE